MNPTKKNLVPDGLFQALIDQYAEALIISDENQRPRYWNSKAESLFGVDEENFCSNQQVLNKISSGAQQPRVPFETDIVRLSLPGLFEEQQFHRTIETLEISGEVWHFIRFTELSTFSLTESELYIQSRTDELSQLLNRRGFQSTLEHNIDKRLALAILDVDYFKRINDNHGHATGDRAIEWIAEQLNSEFTDAVCVGRLGGDEFGVVLEVANENETKLRFEDFCRTISHQRPVFYPPGISISVGVAISKSENTGSRRLLTAGDRAMYQSKQAGRNQSTSVELN
ncbi:MAG: sensor domain-containing diguanylate cyclase [Planctomycetaceae bacterium]|nr:sensor domain-containing diguanylate cyclase [Planctomycetaceae bacterium]